MMLPLTEVMVNGPVPFGAGNVPTTVTPPSLATAWIMIAPSLGVVSKCVGSLGVPPAYTLSQVVPIGPSQPFRGVKTDGGKAPPAPFGVLKIPAFGVGRD